MLNTIMTLLYKRGYGINLRLNEYLINVLQLGPYLYYYQIIILTYENFLPIVNIVTHNLYHWGLA